MEFAIVIFSLIVGFFLICLSGVVSFFIVDAIETDGMGDSMGIVIFLKSIEYIGVSYLIYTAFRGSL